MNREKFFPILIAVAVAVVVLPVFADARAGDGESMGLRSVMKRLGQDMQAVTGAISREDWAMVEELAPEIARHAEPPMAEKVRILRWLGVDAGTFREFDAQVERAADGMAGAAARGDGPQVIHAFAEVQQACLGCHQQYRKPFAKHFYGRR